MRFCLLTYNIHRAIGLDRRFRLDRILRVLDHHEADIVLLQEVDDGVPRSDGLDLAGELAHLAGYRYFAAGYNVRLRKGRYGNATLSTQPIERASNIDLTIGRRKRRGCQHTRIRLGPDLGAPTLDIFNLHLGLSALERRRQVRLLIEAGEFLAAPSPQPCIVGGDFNDWRSQLAATFVGDLHFRSATQIHGSARRFLRTYPSFSPRAGLDRIYYRGGLHLLEVRTSRLAVARMASDHLPVVAEFRLG